MSNSNDSKPKCSPTKKTSNLAVVSAFISKATNPSEPSQSTPLTFSSPSSVSLLTKSSKRYSGNFGQISPKSNFAETSISTSEKRKRAEHFMGPTNTGAKVRKVEDKLKLKAKVLEVKLPACGCSDDAIFDFFKAQVVAEKEAKIKLARMLNNRINENFMMATSFTNILNIVVKGLDCAEGIIPKVVTPDEAQSRFNNSQEMLDFYPGIVDVQSEQINSAYKLRAATKTIDVLKQSLQGTITECSEMRTKIAELNLPKPTVHQIVRSSTPTSSKPNNNRFLTAKKKKVERKVVFSSPIDDRLQQSSSKHTSKIEIEIPGNQSIEPEFLLKGQIEDNIIQFEKQLAKFKNITRDTGENINFATFNISQESAVSSSNELVPDSLPSFDSVPDVHPGIPTTNDVFRAKDGWTALPSPEQREYEKQIREFHQKNDNKENAKNNENAKP